MTDVLRTARLRLRPLGPGDTDVLLPLISNWSVARWLSTLPWPYARADMVEFIGRAAAPDATDGALAIVGEVEAMGVVNIRLAGDPAHHEPWPQMGYWLGQPYWGHGYMTEAGAALIAHRFASAPIEGISSGAFAGNAASLRVLAKLGFEVVGTEPAHCRPQGRELPLVRMRLSRQRYETQRT